MTRYYTMLHLITPTHHTIAGQLHSGAARPFSSLPKSKCKGGLDKDDGHVQIHHLNQCTQAWKEQPVVGKGTVGEFLPIRSFFA
jgi:hypothetical protein